MRALGSIGNEVTVGRGLVIDIAPTEMNDETLQSGDRTIRISMYLVGTNASDEVVVKAMDYKSRSNIAPLVAIRNFDGGVYCRLEYPSGVRIRILPRFGATTVSGIFFDTIDT